MEFQNVYQLFRSQVDKYRDQPVFFTRVDGEWRPQTWHEFEEKVLALSCAFLAKGLTHGASVAILAGNVPEWTICDIAAIAAGGVGVGIYPTSSPEQCAYIIEHSDAEFVIVDTASQLQKLSGLELPKVKEIIVIEHLIDHTFSTGRVSTFDQVLDIGRSNREKYQAEVESIGESLTTDDTAIMVYTSGTTGQPKGAMLSHRYILNSVESLRRAVPIYDTDVAFSYLPGCHVAERISGIYNRLNSGTAAYFVDDLTRLYEYMLEVKPTVFASLPRFFEKIHAKVVSENGTDKLDAQVIKNAFGGRIRLLTSGGAPLPHQIAQFFADAGVPILQAYGLTENICVAFNTFQDLKFGTVGRPMPMCEVDIAADGEILANSPMMFSGYYKQPEKTAEMFNDEGWLLTGDLGEIDDDGYLKITGRKKEMIVLSSGKNVAPALIENYVKESHLISQCFVYGDGRSYCVALITLNPAEIKVDAEAEIASIIETANRRVSTSEQIKRFMILDRDFSAEYDEVTPTLKLKRNIVAKNFEIELENLYENGN